MKKAKATHPRRMNVASRDSPKKSTRAGNPPEATAGPFASAENPLVLPLKTGKTMTTSQAPKAM